MQNKEEASNEGKSSRASADTVNSADRELSVKYIKLSITETSKDIGSKEDYRTFNKSTETFSTIDETNEWLKERYGGHKKDKMFVDDEKGNSHHTGFIFGFRNQDISHNSKWWLQQDWVEIREVTETPMDMEKIKI